MLFKAMLLLAAMLPAARVLSAPFDLDIKVVTGLGEQADTQIADLIRREMSSLITGRKPPASYTPTHRLEIRYTGQVRAGDLVTTPGARATTAPKHSVAFETRGKIECALLARSGTAFEEVQRWEGDYVDAEVLSLGRSKQETVHVRAVARSAILMRVVTGVSGAVMQSAGERWWPTRLADLAVDSEGQLTGTFVLQNQSPWRLEFTPRVVPEVVHPDKPKKRGWYYRHYFPDQTFDKEVVAPGETIERAFALPVKEATTKQIATGKVYVTEFSDFRFNAEVKKVGWSVKFAIGSQETEEASEQPDTETSPDE